MFYVLTYKRLFRVLYYEIAQAAKSCLKASRWYITIVPYDYTGNDAV